MIVGEGDPLTAEEFLTEVATEFPKWALMDGRRMLRTSWFMVLEDWAHREFNRAYDLKEDDG